MRLSFLCTEVHLSASACQPPRVRSVCWFRQQAGEGAEKGWAVRLPAPPLQGGRPLHSYSSPEAQARHRYFTFPVGFSVNRPFLKLSIINNNRKEGRKEGREEGEQASSETNELERVCLYC